MDHPAMTLKRIAAVSYDCTRHENRLWNDISIHAAGLTLRIPASFPPLFDRLPFARPLYRLWAQLSGRVLHAKESMWAWGGTVRYLPPSAPLPDKYERAEALYLYGMLFRNPEGFKMHAPALRERFKGPSSIDHLVAPFANRTIIGVEMRQKPFTYFPHGEFLVSLARTKEAIDEFLRERSLAHEQVALIIASDRPVPRELFAGYDAAYATSSEADSFYALTKARYIIGTNSAKPNLAAWLADAPHIVVSEEAIDWEYYRGQDRYFENRYATFTQTIPRSEIE